MKNLILFFLLLVCGASNAQIDYFTLTRNNGTLMGMAVHETPNNPNGKLDPVILWLHGVDGNRSAPANANDTTRIGVVANKGPLRMVRDAGSSGTFPLFQKPGTTGSNYKFRWNVVAPQNPFSGQDTWACDVVEKAMQYIRDNPSKWDTSCIILVGYSLGGHGIKKCGGASAILNYVKYIVDIAGGTYDVGTTLPVTFANSGVKMDFFITVDDELVTNESNTDSLVRRMKRANAKVMPSYFKLKDITQSTTFPTGGTMANPEHDFMEFLVARDTTVANENSENCVNGDVWTYSENIYERGLRYMGIRRK